MSQQSDDSPYADEPASPTTAPKKPHHTNSKPGNHRGNGRSHSTHATRDLAPAPSKTSSHSTPTSTSTRPRAKRRRGGGSSTHPTSLSSHPTSRNAYIETRQWLLEQHGPICAYCGGTFTAKVMTLDHVAPRRGLTAYDRRDNLVLACPACNRIKRDQAPLSFLLGARTRAANLVRYGEHLSPMLVDLARSLAPEGSLIDDDSPYRD